MVRVPQQKRSREKFSAMMDAAEKLFAKQGIEDTSIQQIVSQAGTSIGAFYQRFENKDALIYTIFYLLLDEAFLDEEGLVTSPDQTLEQTLENILLPIVKVYQSRKGVFLAMMMEEQRNTNIHTYVKEVRDVVYKRHSKALRHHKNEIKHKNIRAAIAMAHRMMTAYLDHTLLWGNDKDMEKNLPFSSSDKELIKMIATYLRGS